MFYERLAKLREQKGLSQREVSKRLGMARTTYSGYENGSREPDLKTVEKLSDFFGVDVSWLVTGSNNTLSEKDSEMLRKFSRLDGKDQEYIIELMERFEKNR